MNIIRKRKRVLLDMDGPLTPLQQKVLDFYNRDYNDNKTLEDLKTYSIRDSIPIGDEVDKYFSYPKFYREMEPLPGSVEAIARLNANPKLDILIVSSPGNVFSCLPDKAEWLDQYFPFLHHRKRSFTSEKHAVDGDYMIDDGTLYLKAQRAEHPHCKLLTIEYPWNQDARQLVDLYAADYRNTKAAWMKVVSFIEEDLAKTL